MRMDDGEDTGFKSRRGTPSTRTSALPCFLLKRTRRPAAEVVVHQELRRKHILAITEDRRERTVTRESVLQQESQASDKTTEMCIF